MKKSASLFLLIMFISPSIAMASWWNPFSWNVWNIIFVHTSENIHEQTENISMPQNSEISTSAPEMETRKTELNNNLQIGNLTTSIHPCPSATATGCDKRGLQQSFKPGCTGTGTAMIGASPIDLDELLYIQPMGLMIGGHVTPIDHGYFYIKGAMEKPARQAKVYSPFSGIITSVTRTARSGPNGNYDDYALSIDATCSFEIRFSNLVKFAGGLSEKIGELKPNESMTPDYSVKEGELIGYTGLPTAYGIDVWVENDNSTLTGFINPDQYAKAELWKLHTVDFFDYTKEPLKSELLAFDMREANPRFGKIDYDIDGKLIGSWFRYGSGGYGGNKNGEEGYWEGHLSIVPDGNDPTQTDISFGNYAGGPKQFAVIGNAPDPKNVSQDSGLIKYELGQIENYRGDTGEIWDHVSYIPHIRTRAGKSVLGTVLMQLTGRDQLRIEIFPGKYAADVSGFDSAALMYER